MAHFGRLSLNRTLNNVSNRRYCTAKPRRTVAHDLPQQNQTVGKAGSVTVATEQTSGNIATIGLFVRAGTGFETPENNGVSHLVKYLAANGTVKNSKHSIAEALENVGGRLSIQTGREKTVFLAQVPKENVETAVKVLGSIVDNLKSFSSAEQFAAAQKRAAYVLEDESNLSDVAFEHLHSIVYQSSSLGLSYKGSAKSLNTLQPQSVADFVRKYYTGDRIVVAGAGSIAHSELVNLVGQNIAGDAGAVSQDSLAAQPFIGSAVTVHDDSSTDVHVTVAFEGAALYSSDHYALMVAQEMIGNYNSADGLSSYSSTRLAELVGTEQLAASFNVFNFGYSNTGALGIQADTDLEHVEDFIAEGITDYVRMSQDPRPNEVNRAAYRVINSLRRERDGSLAVAQTLGEQVLFAGRAIPLKEQFDEIEKVDEKVLSEVCSRHFVDTEPAVVAIGNTLAVPDYNQIRGWTSWWRL